MERVREGPAGGVVRPAAPRALCLAGPTASGKSAIALAFARAHAARQPVELVSVDSAQVYRGLDIGSAKPGADERASVPHHLVDVADPLEPYSAARFVADANEAIDAIRARGHLPLLVGGTMLYLRALRVGLDTLPEADSALRRRLDAEAARAGWPALHAELARVDPQTAARLAPQDAQRIQRALEVWHLTGRPLSALHRGARPAAADLPLVALEPERRDWLHARIARRFDAMLAAGFLDEVRALRARADLHAGLPALRSVGYRQAWAALDAADPPDVRALREAAIAATRRLAKRQLTWLRSMPERHVVAADAPDAPALALERLAALAASG